MISHILSVAQLHNPRLTEEFVKLPFDMLLPQTKFSYRRGLTGMAYRSSSRDLINLHIETKY
jgi:hypothetical protein